jgi:putative protease
MSPQDICTIPFIEKLFEAGVDSLKIEGRNRNAEYVAITTRTYKALRDFYFANYKAKDFKERFEVLKKDAMQELAKVFNRGFSDGFFMGKPIGDWTSAGNQATAKKTIVGHIVKFFPKISVAEISVDVASMSIGERIQIEGDSTGFVEFNLESMQADGKPIQTASKGMSVGVKVPQKLRVGDRVYKLA